MLDMSASSNIACCFFITRYFNSYAATDANKEHTTGNTQKEYQAFLLFCRSGVLILFDDVPTSHRTLTTRLVVPAVKGGSLLT